MRNGIVWLMLALLALGLATRLNAQGTLSLESLAQQLSKLTSRMDETEKADGGLAIQVASLQRRVTVLEGKLIRLSSAIPPTPTQGPTPTREISRRPTPTRLPKLTPVPCAFFVNTYIEIPEPPNRSFDCQTWEVAFRLMAIGLHLPTSILPSVERFEHLEKSLENESALAKMLHPTAFAFVPKTTNRRLENEFYPLVKAAALDCGFSPAKVGDYIVHSWLNLKELASTSASPTAPLGYLLKEISSTSKFVELVPSESCIEEITKAILPDE